MDLKRTAPPKVFLPFYQLHHNQELCNLVNYMLEGRARITTNNPTMFADELAVNISDKLSLENVERVNSAQKTYLPSETGEACQIDQQSNGHTKEFFVLNQFYNLL
ncbi:hypothetical protein CEXT_687251 [Caerostris extrusa]|uniref:Uncharacterized protein n=1 Tax=Caerostris extrusa TaxID=172846 RepID=A0AAV4V5Z4_CAEEX|nr:hypothetical protein CEXT_687251 [Caerostris extrusa]